jgi:hypothetical protein
VRFTDLGPDRGLVAARPLVGPFEAAEVARVGPALWNQPQPTLAACAMRGTAILLAALVRSADRILAQTTPLIVQWILRVAQGVYDFENQIVHCSVRGRSKIKTRPVDPGQRVNLA